MIAVMKNIPSILPGTTQDFKLEELDQAGTWVAEEI